MKYRPINHDLLPILTETADGTVLTPPVLTNKADLRNALLNDAQCQELADRLFPQLEQALHAAIGSRSEAKWAKAMQQVEAALPGLIRDAVEPR
jgi:hypothetical protein